MLATSSFLYPLQARSLRTKTDKLQHILRPKFQNSSSHYASGHYSSAVHRAYEALIVAVRDKAGRPDLDGRDLMFQAFNEQNPILHISDDPAIQEGYKFLFAGAIGAIRNPQAHTTEESLSQEEAIEMLTVCTHLFRLLESSTQVQCS